MVINTLMITHNLNVIDLDYDINNDTNQPIRIKMDPNTVTTNTGRNKGTRKGAEPKFECQVCGDVAAGFHCGAYVCEACKVIYDSGLDVVNGRVCCPGWYLSRVCLLSMVVVIQGLFVSKEC